jgi:hypothetical protein
MITDFESILPQDGKHEPNIIEALRFVNGPRLLQQPDHCPLSFC